jgi:aconitate hydratase
MPITGKQTGDERAMAANNLGSRASLRVGDANYTIYRLDAVPGTGDLPFSLKILLENLLRNEDGHNVTAEHVTALAQWDPKAEPDTEIAFTPARVILQDLTGVPAVVDLATMREAMQQLGGDPARINPLVPAELVIDHSVVADVFGRPDAFDRNVDLEFQRNRERFAFLRWGQEAFSQFKVVPPGTGIVHQVNIEHLARVIMTERWLAGPYPDTCVGTDSTPPCRTAWRARWGVRRHRGRGGHARPAADQHAHPEGGGVPADGRAARRRHATTWSSPSPSCSAGTAWSASSWSSTATASPRCRSPTGPRSAT